MHRVGIRAAYMGFFAGGISCLPVALRSDASFGLSFLVWVLLFLLQLS